MSSLSLLHETRAQQGELAHRFSNAGSEDQPSGGHAFFFAKDRHDFAGILSNPIWVFEFRIIACPGVVSYQMLRIMLWNMCWVPLAVRRSHCSFCRLLLIAVTVAGFAGVVSSREALAQGLSLPKPIVLEDFENVAEGAIPVGWRREHHSTVSQSTTSLQDLNSVSYANWLVVNASRFRTAFQTYSSHTPVDYSRVLTSNPENVVNGRLVTELARGRMLFSDSGYRDGVQVMYLDTSDYDLTGRTNVHVAMNSLYEQNQDNIAALEYSIDRGANWLPVVYYLDSKDILTTAGQIDAVRTFNTRYSDVATYRDPATGATVGGYYGAFIKAPVSQALAPFIAGRTDDDPVSSKRVELFRLAAADNQAAVRFRFAHAGTDSWYWGIDNFGLYSITPGQMPVIVAAPADLEVTAGLEATFRVVAAGVEPLAYQWLFNGTNIAGATNAILTLTPADNPRQGDYTVVISNLFGVIESGPARLTLSHPRVTGQWDFDQGDLRATVGADLEFVADTASVVSFAPAEFQGGVAGVMEYGPFSPRQGLYMRHGANPNGGGRFVNRYTLLMDVRCDFESSGSLRAVLQTDPFNHDGNEADFLIGAANGLGGPNGLGADSQFHGSAAPDQWHRIAFAADLAAEPGRQLSKYIDGVLVGQQSLPGGIDGRYALGPTALLFTGGLAAEAAASGAVNSIQFVDTWLTPAAIAELGNPTAQGLPSGEHALTLTLAAFEGEALRLQWTGPAGWYEVQKATKLTPPDWEVCSNPTSNHTIVLQGTGEAAFYRVRQSEANMTVGQLPGGAQSLPSMQLVRPAGDSLQFSGRPVDLALSPDRQTVYVKNINNLLVIDANAWRVRQTLPYPAGGASMHGIAVSPDGRRVYVTGAGNELYEWGVDAEGVVTFSRTIGLPAGSYPCGIALFGSGDRAAVCLSIPNRLAIVNLTTGTLLSSVRVGIAPWDVVLSPDESTAFVSDWGGRWPDANDLKAPSAGTPVVVDERGIGASGVVSFVNLAVSRETGQVPTGLHPSDLELSPDGRALYVANANSDTVTIIDTTTRSVRENVLVRPDDDFPYGSAPTGLALSADGSRLFVALGGNNCIAVVALSATPGESAVTGFLPTDWYPGAVAAVQDRLYVASVKGLGSRLGQPTATSYQIGAHLGTANRITIPDQETLSKLSARSFEDGRVPAIRRAHERGVPTRPPVPVPARLGEPSVFEHVLYILKENKTYDQMFGDIKEGNGDPNLCIYPELVSPNHHALARQYVLLDNFYCNGVVSADGHSWSTEANVTDHLEKAFGGFARSYTFGDDPLTYSSSGFIWDNVLRHGLSFRNYGEMDYASPSGNETWLQIYDDFVSGRRSVRYLQNIGIENLRRCSSTNVPGWNMGIPDIVRADGFLRELREAEARGAWENFSFLYLPNDHTGGPPTPRAQVADNDLALGRVVEAVTRSRFATNTVIFVIEDDPQSGYDHVDAHRSLCLVISPYTRREAVISTFYNQAGVVHTMERILGLPPMNQQDAMAPLMFDCFTNVPDFAPYTARANNIPLDEGARKVGSLTPAQLHWAAQLKTMDFSKPDRIDDDLFNRYIWFANKGDAPYPVEFVGAHGKGLKQLGLVLAAGRADEEED